MNETDTDDIDRERLKQFIGDYRADATKVKAQPEIVEGGDREGVAYAEGLLSVCKDLERLLEGGEWRDGRD